MDLIKLGDHCNVVQICQNCCSHPCVSCIVVDLGARTKCRYFSKLYANNCVWKNIKIIKLI